MYRIGFDIGGTNIKGGIINERGELKGYRRVSLPKGEHYKKLASRMGQLAGELTAELGCGLDQVKSIGVAVPGNLDSKGEKVLHAHNLHYHNIPLKAVVKEEFPQIPVFLCNDADAAATAELYAGVFQKRRSAVLITLGTGVGGAIIMGGKLFQGGRGQGVELGHMTLHPRGAVCTCGQRGCVEAYCAGTWLLKQGRKAVVEEPFSMVYRRTAGNMDRVNAKLVVDCAKAGDSIAVHIVEEYIENLSTAIASIVVLQDPEIIALAGGISLAGDFLYKPLNRMVKEKSFFRCSTLIVPSALGNDGGIIGAAMLSSKCKSV